MKTEELLTLIYNELESKAYDTTRHTYYFKEANQIIRKYIEIYASQQNYTPYQLCPKCNGDGDLARYNSPSITSLCPVCDVCNGAKIIPMSLI